MIIQYAGRKITFLASHVPEILILLLGRRFIKDKSHIFITFLFRRKATLNNENRGEVVTSRCHGSNIFG